MPPPIFSISLLSAFLVLQPEALPNWRPRSRNHQESLQTYSSAQAGSEGCPHAPKLHGRDLQDLIRKKNKIVIVAIPRQESTKAVMKALESKGMPYAMEEFRTNSTYERGRSEIWDWLHCSFPEDTLDGKTMPSYVFRNGAFLGHGFAAARKALAGELNSAPSQVDGTGSPNNSHAAKKLFSASTPANNTGKKSPNDEDEIFSACLAQDKFKAKTDYLRTLVTSKRKKDALVFRVDHIEAEDYFQEHHNCFSLKKYNSPWVLDLEFLQCLQGDSGLTSLVYVSCPTGDGGYRYHFAGDGTDRQQLENLIAHYNPWFEKC